MWRPAPLILSLVLAACAGHRVSDDREPKEAPFHAPIEILMRYDANHDGTITRAEMEAGLKADFAAADLNHDGCLDADEAAAVNHARWAEGLSTTSTIVDWNHDGCVDFNEFANTARSLFDEIDRDGDGVLTPRELRPYGGSPPKPASKGETSGASPAIPPDGH
jgi:Ca2+-binding EF-hand superfamily protein